MVRKTKTKKPFKPDAAQVAALRAFAVKYDKRIPGGWKAHLMTCWMNGHDAAEPNGHLLRQVRNQCGGPTWLQNCKLDF